MSTYNVRIAQVAGSYDEIQMIMIDATITYEDGRFSQGALPFEAIARDGANELHSFMAFLSPNGKELHAFFTVDAFTVFPGLFAIEFGPHGQVVGTVQNVDIAGIIPLDPSFAALGLPNADNTWLSAL